MASQLNTTARVAGGRVKKKTEEKQNVFLIFLVIIFSEIYSEKYIDDMVDVLFKNKYMKPVTYAVRASIAANSLPELQYLLETSPAGSTLTAWCSDPEDVIDNPKLVRLIGAVGANRMYLDLPEDVSKKLLELYAVSGAEAGAGGLGASVLSLTSLLAVKNGFF